MEKWYEADSYGGPRGFGNINTVSVSRTTKTMVKIGDRMYKKESEYTKYCQTFEEAREWLIAQSRAHRKQHEISLNKELEKLVWYRSLEEPL